MALTTFDLGLKNVVIPFYTLLFQYINISFDLA